MFSVLEEQASSLRSFVSDFCSMSAVLNDKLFDAFVDGILRRLQIVSIHSSEEMASLVVSSILILSFKILFPSEHT